MPYNWNNYNTPKKAKANTRPDHNRFRAEYERNKKKILVTQDICAICGQPVDKSLKYPDPYCATIDHKIPISKGGHPSALDNLQLAHNKCNRAKSDKIINERTQGQNQNNDEPDNRDFPWAINWLKFNGENGAELAKEAEELEKKGFVMTAEGIKLKH